MATEAVNPDGSRRNRLDRVGMVAQLAGWPTCTAQDTGLPLPQHAALAGWPTPNAGPQNDTDSRWQDRRAAIKAKGTNGNGFGMTLGMAATLAGPARLTVSGEMLTGSDAGMESGGQLSPDHSFWLMGIPAEWVNFAPQGTRSLRRKRLPSSKPPSTSSIFD
ncbi:hypothetical protein [Thauera sp.]|uniref:hypothetical protein n=1 Tax=Thauera sp. TaxID=1905334 RepID=UPI002BF7CC96|nr:hypothetical protein [Thauera sp.]HRP25375.1 hypothetical protein [Thauera sp.]